MDGERLYLCTSTMVNGNTIEHTSLSSSSLTRDREQTNPTTAYDRKIPVHPQRHKSRCVARSHEVIMGKLHVYRASRVVEQYLGDHFFAQNG